MQKAKEPPTTILFEKDFLVLPQLITNAKFLHGIGRTADAEKIYKTVLSHDAYNAEVLGLLASLVYIRGDLKLAKKLWRRSLTSDPTPWIFLRNLHAYLQVLVNEGASEQAAVLTSFDIPPWPVMRLPDVTERKFLMAASDMLIELGQGEFAIRLLSALVRSSSIDSCLLYALAKSQMDRGALELAWKALNAVDQAISPAFDLPLSVDLGMCARRRGDKSGEELVRKRMTAASPILLAERSPFHKRNILILNGRPDIRDSLSSFDALHLPGNYPSQLASVFKSDFHFSSVFDADPVGRAASDNLPTPDLVINNYVNGEVILSGEELPNLTKFADSFGALVINHPRNVPLTTRDASLAFIQDIPGIVLPKTIRFCSSGKTCDQLVLEIGTQFAYPLITRALANQEGVGMSKVENKEDLRKALLADARENFFVTEFIDSRTEKDGFFRKIRAAVVGEEIIIVRVDYDTGWNVHGRKSDERVAFYIENSYLLAQEKRICMQPNDELGKIAMQALEGIRDHIPLDIFGVDFDVDSNGGLVFFEANASMNLFSTARPEVEHPKESEDRLKIVFRNYLEGLIKGT